MADRPLTILEVTHAGHQAGSTVLIHSLCAPLVKRGHRVLVGWRRRLYPGARLRPVPNGIDVARVDAPPTAAAMSAAAAALGDVAGRPVIAVLARRKDQHILLEALATVERPVVVAFVGIEPDDQLRAVAARLPPRHRVVYVPFTDQPLAFYRLAAIAAL